MPCGLQLSYYKSAGLLALFSHADGFCALGAPTKHRCITLLLLPTQTLPHTKLSPQKPWQKFFGGVQQTSMSSLVTSLDPQPLPLLLPTLGSTAPTVSHTLVPGVAASDQFLFFFFRQRLICYSFNYFIGVLIYITTSENLILHVLHISGKLPTLVVSRISVLSPLSHSLEIQSKAY